MKKEAKNKDWKTLLEQEIRLRGYSDKTLKAYTYHITKYISSGLTPREYILSLTNKDIHENSVRLAGFAIKFYFSLFGADTNEVLDNLPNIKPPKSLPNVLSKKEIEKMIKSTHNLKHRLIIQTAYSAGLRVSELIKLRWQDIDFKRNTIHIKRAKGKKDRVVMLSPKVKKGLRSLGTDQISYVFKTKNNKPYIPRSIQQLIANTAKKAGITKKVTPHTLRHTYATHLVEHGIDIRIIQDLLGHVDLHTTMIYTKVSTTNLSKIKTPLDH